MKLNRLSLRNFQGIRDLEITPEGRSLAIYGANGTGKTTIKSAWLWLLFGKNAAGQSDFAIKTLDQEGEPHRGLDHEVEAEISLDDGRRMTLRRSYREQWTKRRGEARKEFTGHTTDYSIDGVPVKKKDFDAQIDDICTEDRWRVLTDPEEFPERVRWEDRRKVLVDLAGDLTDADVIAEDERFAELGRMLNGRTLDDLRKIITESKAKINAKLDDLPTRIDEASRDLPEIPEGEGEESVRARLAQLQKERDALAAERAAAQSGGGVAEKSRRLQELQGEMLAAKNRSREASDAAANAVRDKLQGARDEKAEAEAEASRLRRESREKAEEAERLESQMALLRNQFQEVSSEEFRGEETCPTCGQPLPAEKVEAAKESFLSSRAERAREIQEQGGRLKERCEEILSGAEGRDSAVAAADLRVEAAESEIVRLQGELETARASAAEPEADAEQQRVAAEIRAVESEIEKLRAGTSEAVAAVDARAAEVNARISAVERLAASFELRARKLKRIEDLQAQEAGLAAEFEELERQLNLVDECEREKARLLDESVSRHFKIARFKLFKERINGGLEPCCEVTYNGVPYSTGLNHGARISVGLDIISTLQEHLDFRPPCFIDQAESFTSLPPMDCQTFRLIVSMGDDELRIENDPYGKQEKPR